jgi:hypothetical protein
MTDITDKNLDPGFRLRPDSKWFRIREGFILWIAKFVDVPVATFFASRPPYDYDPIGCGPRYLLLFRRYNHMKHGQQIS